MPVIARKSVSSHLPSVASVSSSDNDIDTNNKSKSSSSRNYDKDGRESSSLLLLWPRWYQYRRHDHRRTQQGYYSYYTHRRMMILILIMIRSCVLILFMGLLFRVVFHKPYSSLFTLSPSSSSTSIVSTRKRQEYNQFVSSQQQRIAICLPYLQQDKSSSSSLATPFFPPYFPLFLQTAKGSSSLIDFFIFYLPSSFQKEEEDFDSLFLYQMYDIPSNVKLIHLHNMTYLATLLSQVVLIVQEDEQDEKEGDNPFLFLTKKQKQVIPWLETFLSSFPYLLVEYKPAYGYIFQQYLTSYSHWGYSDLDIVWGDVPRWITQEELQNFDIVTYGFGDQERLYLRGQFTFHKNNPKINTLWRTCSYLSHLDQRITQHDTPKLESAEGCYSYAILQYHDLRVKYAVKAFSDAETQQEILTKHGLYIGLDRMDHGSTNTATVLYTAGNNPHDGLKLVSLPSNWFLNETLAQSYVDYNIPIQRDVGEREPIMRVGDNNAKCMFWVRSEYQKLLCLNKDQVDQSYTLYWIDGQLYRQKYETMTFPSNIQSAPFFHFQEWKRTYSRSSQFVSIKPRLDQLDSSDRLHGWIMLPEGLVPMLPHTSNKSSLTNRLDGYKRLKETFRLPKKSYCLRWKRIQVEYTETTSCESYVSWTDSSKVHLIQNIPTTWNQNYSDEDITLALTLEITKEQANHRNIAENLLSVAASNMVLWKDHPCILLVYVADTSNWVRNLLDETFQQQSYNHCLIGTMQSEDIRVSRKALRNMVNDASPTRWTISGIDLERGLVLSREAWLFSKRAIMSVWDTPGYVFIIPQFNLVHPIDTALSSSFLFNSTSLIELLRIHEHHPSSISTNLENIGCVYCPTNLYMDKEISSMYDTWWYLSLLQIISSPEIKRGPDETIQVQDPPINDYLAKVMRLLTTKNLQSLQEFDSSPILLVDALGPKDGMYTELLVQEVEEFAGSSCMNALKLAQLITLQYNVQVLSGAFALASDHLKFLLCSTHRDKSIKTPSPCDGCFMFKNHNELFHIVAREEAVRTAKTSLLWAERNAMLY